MKGPSQNLARNTSERDYSRRGRLRLLLVSAARVGQPAEEGEALHRNPSRGWHRDGRNRDVCDRGRPRGFLNRPTTCSGTEAARETKCLGVHEESERFIVAMTPGESREQ